MQAQLYIIPAGWLHEGDYDPERRNPETGEIIEYGDIHWETRHEALGYLQAEGKNLRLGDIVLFEDLAGWGNHARYIVGEAGVEPLDYIWSEEIGAIPAEFSIQTYPPHYWDSAVPGVNIVYLDLDPYEGELLSNLIPEGTSLIS